MLTLGQAARAATAAMARANTAQKNQALLAIADTIAEQREAIKKANVDDCAAARANGLDAAMLDRLGLSDKSIDAMCEGLAQVAKLPDPVGEITDMHTQPSGIKVGKMRVPLGVIGMIYESRPNVTIDAAALCLKSGNVAILRGGSEAFRSNQLLAQCVQTGLAAANLPGAAVQLVPSTDRAAVGHLLTMDKYVDIIIPRGGKSLVTRVAAEATVPVIKHLDGNCHIYVDEYADADKALHVVVNGKTRRFGVCGATESLLVHQARGHDLRQIAQALHAKGIELRGCAHTQTLLADMHIVAATEDDWSTEYLGPVLSIKMVDSLEAAIAHINHYGSHHTDAIITENWSHAQGFQREVDSASVMVNASTQFADGFEYGLGAEIGISTDKLHVRGPVGLVGLTSQKWLVWGDGTVRA
ncbi:MAG: hypothetical protein RLZZ502_1543 [Pseudomonadota bacterium]|jgi:glutamate-5-semialdehyde dehydrogenase